MVISRRWAGVRACTDLDQTGAGCLARAASPDFESGTIAMTGDDRRPPPILAATEALFDGVPDTVWFVKDGRGAYLAVNSTLVERLGKRHKHEVLGRTVVDLFPPAIARAIHRQDLDTLAGRSVVARLELHLRAGGGEGWCLTWKEPVRDGAGRIAGLTGVSRDLDPGRAAHAPADLAALVAHVESHVDRPLAVADLAARCGLSPWRLDRRLRAVFGLTAGQLVARARMDAATALLRSGDEPVAAVALACGYGDQAAFTRAFRRAVGLTPSAYRIRSRGRETAVAVRGAGASG
jgi:PAS domain S-box-containing protein